MKKFYILLSLFFISTRIFGTHNISGEISFTHINGFTYQVQIITYTKESSPADRPYLPVYYGDGTSDSLARVNGNGTIVATDIKQNIYTGQHTYPGNGTYIIYMEDPNRNGGIVNIPNSINVPFYTESKLIISPAIGINNSVQFIQMPIVRGCVNTSLKHNVTAYDPDEDCLTFELVSCKGAGGLPILGYTLPNFISIDSVNGEITWLNPAVIGAFSYAVKVNEWRNGVIIGYVIRDFEITSLAPPPEQYYFSGNAAWQVDGNGNYSYTLFAGDTLQLNLSYTDSFASIVDLDAYSEALTVSNPATFMVTLTLPTIGSLFEWIPDPSHVRSAPYIVTFRGRSDDIENDVSLLIYVVDGNTVPCDFSTSVGELNTAENHVSVFPNPCQGIFTIQGSEHARVNRLIIYDAAGRMVKDLQLNHNGEPVDVSEISDGFYIYELRHNDTAVAQGKLVKGE